MNINDLKPAREFALRYGCKSVIYGAAGAGKTPILNTAPRPMLIITEPGMLSMRQSTIPTIPAFTADEIEDRFKWLFTSTETKNFDTVGVDSISQMAEIYLKGFLQKFKDGRKAYGEMSRAVMDKLEGIYFLQQKHTYLIAKEQKLDDNGMLVKRPYMPGQDLPVKIPHLFDAILHLATVPIPGVGQQKAFRCISSIDVMARDRSGNMNEFEPPNFNEIVKKAMI